MQKFNSLIFMKDLIITERLSEEKTEKLIENYHFTERGPLKKEISDLCIEGRPSVLKSKEIGDRILNKILGFVDTFVNDISGSL